MQLNGTDVQLSKHKKIEKELDFQGRTIHWLANNLNLCYQHTYRLVRGHAPLSEKTADKIYQLLQIKD